MFKKVGRGMTPTEIVKHLRMACHDCNPAPCCEYEVLGSEAADLIETLTARAERAEAESKELRQEIDITDAANTALEGALKQAEAELKEAVEDINSLRGNPAPCLICEFDDLIGCCHKNHCNENNEYFKWRGARKEGKDG